MGGVGAARYSAASVGKREGALESWVKQMEQAVSSAHDLGGWGLGQGIRLRRWVTAAAGLYR